MSSSLYCELTFQELVDIVAKILHTEVTSAHLLTGGLFNTTYLVDTQKYGQVVLRVGPVNRHLLMPFEHHLMEAEGKVYELCKEYDIPASEILAMDTSKTLIDRDFMFVRYISSQPMNEVTLSSEDKKRICRDIGIATAKLHSITKPSFGRIVDVENGKGFSLWSEFLQHELQQWASVAISTTLFSDVEHFQIRRLFEKAAPYLDEIKTPCLVHTDLWLGNILIRTDTEKPEFAAIIDADRAIWGDPEFEFSSIRWMLQDEHFWKGYGSNIFNDEHSVTRRAIYRLLAHLWNSYVYLKEYNQPEQAWAERTMACEQMKKLQEALL